MSSRPMASYSLTVRLRIANLPGMLGKVTSAIGEAGGDIGAVDIVEAGGPTITRNVSFKAGDEGHGERIVERLRRVEGVTVVNVSDRTFLMHLGGKIATQARVAVKTRDDLSMVYTPGVARVCMAIHAEPEKAYNLTIKQNTVAVVSDGSAVLGLGNIGPFGAAPVMEGKCLIFKEFAGVDAFPLCLATQDVDEIVRTVMAVSPIFGGINLEDISAPRCFEIEERLQEALEIPVFHDDQHGTAVVVLAALLNALKIVKKSLSEARIVFVGAGASGIATAKLLMLEGAQHIVACDRVRPPLPRPHRQHELDEAVVRRAHEPEGAARQRRHRRRGRRRVHRAVRAGRGVGGGHQDDGSRPDRVRDGQPDAGDHARGGGLERARDGDRTLRLSEPDQQLLLLPRLLPRHARRAGPAGQRRDEAGRGARAGRAS